MVTDGNNAAKVGQLQGAIRVYKEFSEETFADGLLEALEHELTPKQDTGA